MQISKVFYDQHENAEKTIIVVVVIVVDLFRLISNTINKKPINKFKIGWKFEENKKPCHQAPTQLH